MPLKRPLDEVVPPPPPPASAGQQDAAPGARRPPTKRLRRAGLVMMWLRPKITREQLAMMVRQVLELLMTVFLQHVTILNQISELRRIVEATSRDLPGLIRSAVCAEMQETRAVLLSNTVHQHPGNPTVCRPQLNAVEAIPEGLEQTGDKNRMLQLRFVSNNPKSTLYTGRIVKWKNGRNVKVAIFENDNQVRHGDISKVKVDIVAVRSDFFTKQGQEYFTKEEFERQICTNGDEELVLATVNLNDGECYLDSFFFTVSSHRQRWRLAARVNSQVPRVRFKEAITDPFVVKVGRSKSNAKSYPPKKGDDVYRLEKISRKGKVRDNLMGEGITNVKHLLRHYYKDGSALKKLTHMANKTWKTMITHAKTCKPGNELYAYSAIEENCVVFFNDFYDLVGVKLDGAYTPYGNLNQSQKDKVIKYKMAAHKMFEELEKEGSLNHGYEMIDGHPSPVASNGVGPSTQTTLTSQQYSHYQNQGFGHCQPSPPQNGSYLSAPIFQNNMVVPSAQETPASERSYDQNVDKEFGNQNPFSQHNGLSNCNFPGNVLNQCSFASQPPSAIPGQYNDLIRDSSQGFQINGSLCLTSSDIVVHQQFSSHNHREVVFDESTMLFNEHGGYSEPLLANDEPANSNTSFCSGDFNMDDFIVLPNLPDPSS